MTALPIPTAALGQHIVVLGKTRSGKSTTMRVLVEGLLDRKKPVCIVDPKGDWWGLKSSADGKSAGYPIVIFGGPHGDVPINEHSGAAIAELIATGNRPSLIDLKGWMPAARTRFWVDFSSALFKLTKGLRWLVVDEVHNFAPKAGHLDPDAAKALHWTNRLASEGLGMGLHMIFASQRPQKVHNDTLTSAETLIAMRVIHPSDRDAVSDWIKGCGDPKLGAEVLGTLADMNRGEGWVWSPEIKFGPKRIQFPLFSTYDSFKPQPVEATLQLKGWASVDLEDVKAKLSKVVEEAKANDPAALKKQIADMRRQLAGWTPTAPGTDATILLRERQAGFMEGRAVGLVDGFNDAIATVRPLAEAMKSVAGQAGRVSGALDGLIERKPTAAPPMRKIPAPTVVERALPSTKPRVAPVNGSVDGPTQKILDALAWWTSIGTTAPSKAQVAFAAGYSPNGGAFLNPLGRARTNGLIDYPSGGHVQLTEAGAALAQPPEMEPTTDALHRKIMAILEGPQQKILAPLLAAYPDSMTKVDLASAAGYSPDGGAFLNPLGKLRTLGLIAKGQPIRATDILFVR